MLTSEADFQKTVEGAARFHGFLAYHTYDSRRSEPGFPDLVLVRPPRLLFVEMKTEKGVVSAAQKKWLIALSKCPPAEAHIWRPSEWKEIEGVLK